MTSTVAPQDQEPISDASDHITEARRRAREVLSGEGHLGYVDDWRRAVVSARDSLILLWLVWVGLYAFNSPPFTLHMLLALVFALAALVGISTGRSTHAQIQYYASELEREREEIKDNFDHECEEVRALYAAKGFREPLLGQVVDTLTADDDRLLKVMMEEELGLLMHHVRHPLSVGVLNFAGALAAGLALIVPPMLMEKAATVYWMTGGAVVLLAIVSLIAARATRKGFTEVFAAGCLMAIATGGVAFWLCRWFADQLAG